MVPCDTHGNHHIPQTDTGFNAYDAYDDEAAGRRCINAAAVRSLTLQPQLFTMHHIHSSPFTPSSVRSGVCVRYRAQAQNVRGVQSTLHETMHAHAMHDDDCSLRHATRRVANACVWRACVRVWAMVCVEAVLKQCTRTFPSTATASVANGGDVVEWKCIFVLLA